MLRSCSVLALLFAATFGSAAADEIPADARKKVFEAIKTEAAKRPAVRQQQAELKALLEHANAGVVDKSKKDVFVPPKIDKKNPIRFPSAAARSDYVKDLEAKINKTIDQLRGPDDAPESFAPEVSVNGVGSWGVFAQKVVTVDRVINKNTAVIKTRTETTAKPLDGKEVLVLVEGVDTSKYADNQNVGRPAGVFYVTGNQKVGGQTYFHLVAVTFSADEVKELTRLAKGEK
jgi:hypothetical protein